MSHAHLKSSSTAALLSPVSCVLAASWTNLAIEIWNTIKKKKSRSLSLMQPTHLMILLNFVGILIVKMAQVLKG